VAASLVHPADRPRVDLAAERALAGALVAGSWPKTPLTTPLPTAPAVIADPTSAAPTGYVALFLRPGPDAVAGDIDIVASRP